MTKPIAAGDLVVVVKPIAQKCKCAGKDTETLGKMFIVADLSHTTSCCKICGHHYSVDFCAWWPNGNVTEVHRLRRIPPLSELEGQRTQEDIREPA